MSGNGNGHGSGDPPTDADVFVLVFGHGDNYSVASNVPTTYSLGMLCGAIVQVATNEGFGLPEIFHSMRVAWKARKGGGT